MTVVSLIEWNHFLHGYPHAHLLQTGEWGELKSSFAWEAVRVISGEVGAQILFRKLPFGFTIAYIPKPVFSMYLSKLKDCFLDEVDFQCRRHHAIFCKLEPDIWESGQGSAISDRWSISSNNIQPPRTIIINIQGTEEEILAHMKQKTRYNIRLAEKKCVTVRAWMDFSAFHNMMMITGVRDKFSAHSLEYYRRAYELFHPTGSCEMLVAEYDHQPLAALMVFARGRRAWFVYGASTDEQRNRMPSYLLQWEAIRWARSHGCEEYDLWGVPDADIKTLEANFESRTDGLWGVYRFKRGFGGNLKRAVQSLDRVYVPWLYRLYLRRLAGREGL
jgi:peptidoglycan pentaglycine glycine transferase (the first glycine)